MSPALPNPTQCLQCCQDQLAPRGQADTHTLKNACHQKGGVWERSWVTPPSVGPFQQQRYQLTSPGGRSARCPPTLQGTPGWAGLTTIPPPTNRHHLPLTGNTAVMPWLRQCDYEANPAKPAKSPQARCLRSSDHHKVMCVARSLPSVRAHWLPKQHFHSRYFQYDT